MQHNAFRDAMAAGTPDVSLSPVPNWADLTAADVLNAPIQMLGIDSPITLRVTTSAMPAWVTVNIYIGTSSNMNVATQYPVVLAVQTNFVVKPGMWVAFSAADGGNGATGTIQVMNVSDSNTVLDTINITLTP